MLHEGLRHHRDGHESEGIEDLETAAAAGWLEARYQLALLYARKGRRRGALRQQAIGHLERSSLENTSFGAHPQIDDGVKASLRLDDLRLPSCNGQGANAYAVSLSHRWWARWSVRGYDDKAFAGDLLTSP